MLRARTTNRELEDLMSDVNDYGTQTAENMQSNSTKRESRWSGFSAGLATLVSVIALGFSAFSFYETVLKQASLRFYQPPLMYMYREAFRDVFAIPITISNDGAQRGTIMSFDLEVEHLGTKEKKSFQNLHFGVSPRGDKKMFTPISVAGRTTYSNVVLFHALKTGSFVSTTGGVKLPLRVTLKMNLDETSGWFAVRPPPPVTFEMTAPFIQGFRNMESGTPTQLHDARWTNAKAKAAAKK